MKTKLVKSFVYNGLSIDLKPLSENEHREVTILGVPLPCDPGIVLIQDGETQRQVPVLVLADCPKIDFGQLLTPQQIRERDAIGGLLGPGVTAAPPDRPFIPLEECPLKATETS